MSCFRLLSDGDWLLSNPPRKTGDPRFSGRVTDLPVPGDRNPNKKTRGQVKKAGVQHGIAMAPRFLLRLLSQQFGAFFFKKKKPPLRSTLFLGVSTQKKHIAVGGAWSKMPIYLLVTGETLGFLGCRLYDKMPTGFGSSTNSDKSYGKGH